MAAAMKVVFGLLTFVTIGMITGALFQLAFIDHLKDPYGTGLPSSKRIWQTQALQVSTGMSSWASDKEAAILRLGLVRPELLSWSPRIIVLRNFFSMEDDPQSSVLRYWGLDMQFRESCLEGYWYIVELIQLVKECGIVQESK